MNKLPQESRTESLLFHSLGFLKSAEQIKNKEIQIKEHSDNENYLPLSFVELSLLEKEVD